METVLFCPIFPMPRCVPIVSIETNDSEEEVPNMLLAHSNIAGAMLPGPGMGKAEGDSDVDE